MLPISEILFLPPFSQVCLKIDTSGHLKKCYLYMAPSAQWSKYRLTQVCTVSSGHSILQWICVSKGLMLRFQIAQCKLSLAFASGIWIPWCQADNVRSRFWNSSQDSKSLEFTLTREWIAGIMFETCETEGIEWFIISSICTRYLLNAWYLTDHVRTLEIATQFHQMHSVHCHVHMFWRYVVIYFMCKAKNCEFTTNL